MIKRFKVFITDGEKLQQIFFINQTEAGDFYFGSIIEGLDSTISRHQSGKTHHKFLDNTLDLYKGQKISEFRGFEYLMTYAVGKNVFKESIIRHPYQGKKFDGSVFIDLRNYNNLIYISPILLEPGKIHMLTDLIENFFNNLQITIFTQTKPWIVLFVYERKKNPV